MRLLTLFAFIVVVGVGSASALAPARTLTFPTGEARELGQIEGLRVSVHCGYITGLRNIPELHNIKMGYDIPSENILEASPRLGAAAVELPRWNGVIEVSGSDDCFTVKVEADGRTGKTRQYTGRQLGLSK